MKKCSHSAHQTLSELNITPLLDLAFVLLVIFIITTTPLISASSSSSNPSTSMAFLLSMNRKMTAPAVARDSTPSPQARHRSHKKLRAHLITL